MSDTIRGLYTCQPRNEPQPGEVRNVAVIDMGNHIKVSPRTPDEGGSPYRFVYVKQTEYNDQHGNISFNVQIEKYSEKEHKAEPVRKQIEAWKASPERARMFTRARAEMQKGSEPAQNFENRLQRDDYWRSKEQRDIEKGPRIERQHSQHMALLMAGIDARLVMDEEGRFSTRKFRELVSWCQRDLDHSCYPVAVPEEPFEV